jgi:hypothetical protein
MLTLETVFPPNDERPDLLRDQGARAALPQNCSPMNVHVP